jgi:hypothetical protein
MAKLSGGGIQSNKNVSVGQRLGTGSKGSSPAAAGQIGASTAFRRDQVDGRPVRHQLKLPSTAQLACQWIERRCEGWLL